MILGHRSLVASATAYPFDRNFNTVSNAYAHYLYRTDDWRTWNVSCFPSLYWRVPPAI